MIVVILWIVHFIPSFMNLTSHTHTHGSVKVYVARYIHSHTKETKGKGTRGTYIKCDCILFYASSRKYRRFVVEVFRFIPQFSFVWDLLVDRVVEFMPHKHIKHTYSHATKSQILNNIRIFRLYGIF